MLNDRGPNIQKKKSVLYPYKYKKNLQKTSLCLHFLEQKKNGVRCSTIEIRRTEDQNGTWY